MEEETPWQAVGRIARKRREYLQMNQEDLADFGGPKVATVGKFERAAADNFPTRTRNQMERALGWPIGVVDQLLEALTDPSVSPSVTYDMEKALIDAPRPDLSRPHLATETNVMGYPQTEQFEGHMLLLRSTLSSVVPELQNEAAVEAASAMLAVSRSGGMSFRLSTAPAVDRLSEVFDRTDTSVPRAADEDPTPIERGQGHDENA